MPRAVTGADCFHYSQSHHETPQRFNLRVFAQWCDYFRISSVRNASADRPAGKHAAGKRRPFSPHEREIEPCFWSRAENSERIVKKSHAPKLSNDNRTHNFIARCGIPAVMNGFVVIVSSPTC